MVEIKHFEMCYYCEISFGGDNSNFQLKLAIMAIYLNFKISLVYFLLYPL